MPYVTIGISFKNNESTIENAVRSVFSQSFEDWELILVDDGSDDKSLDIVKKINDSRVKVLFDGKRKGLPARLNQITSLARGKYVARMDADDIMHPERISKQVKFLDENPEIDVVGMPVYTIDDHTNLIGISRNKEIDVNPKSVLRKGLLNHPSVMGKTKWFISNPYDESFLRSQDRELWARTIKHSKFAKLEEPLFYKREGKDQTISKYLESTKSMRRILLLHGPRLASKIEIMNIISVYYIKAFLFIIASFLGLRKKMIENRSTKINNDQFENGLKSLEQVLNTQIPIE